MNMLRGIGDAVANARFALVVTALGLYIAGLLLTGERWRVVIAALGTRLSTLRATLINLAGIFIRNATPSTGLGGDATRIALLRVEGLPLAQATAAFAYVRLVEIPPLAITVALSIPAIAGVGDRSRTGLTVVAAAIGFAAAAAWVGRRRLRARLADLEARTGHLRIDRRAAGWAVFYAVAAQAETIARLIVVAAAFGVPLTIQQSAAITWMTLVGGVVPTVGGLGAIDGSIVAGLMLFGIPAETAIAVTLVERAISYVFSTAAGAVALALVGGRTLLRAAWARRPPVSVPERSRPRPLLDREPSEIRQKT